MWIRAFCRVRVIYSARRASFLPGRTRLVAAPHFNSGSVVSIRREGPLSPHRDRNGKDRERFPASWPRLCRYQSVRDAAFTGEIVAKLENLHE